MTTLRLRDENGNTFEVWLVKRSFALLAPVCRMGMGLLALVLLVFDPLYAALDLWPDTIPHTYLVAWHLASLLFFGLVLLAIPHAQDAVRQSRVLAGFIVWAQLLFAWFGVVSWLGLGDFSLVAVAHLMIACVFQCPGYLRRTTYIAQPLLITACLAVLDRSGRFLGEMQFINLVVVSAAAWAMDGYMLRHARAYFDQQCQLARARQRADEVLYSALPASIADELKAHNCVQAQRHARMTVLFADLVGFSRFASAVPPDTVVDLLNAVFSRFDALAEQHQVEKIKTMGDAYMAVHLGDTAAMARFALDLLQVMEAINASHQQHFELRVGMHTGTTVSGVIGQKRLLYDVWGDAVNLASRMESQGVAGRIQISQACYLALEGRFCMEPRGEQHIKGMGRMPTYFLNGTRSSQAPDKGKGAC